MATTLKTIISLVLLLTLIHLSTSTRILDEQSADPALPAQPSDQSLPNPSDPPTDIPDQPATPTSTDTPPTADAPAIPASPEIPIAAAPAIPDSPAIPIAPAPAIPDSPAIPIAPAPAIPASPAIPLAANTGAITDTGAHPITFFMHDIVGGTKPSVRIVTGVVASSSANGNLPFARPNHDIFPIQGALPLPQNANNLLNSNNVPYVAGLSGSSSTIVQNNINPQNANAPTSNNIPFVNAGDLPSGVTLENLLFGTTTVIDDELTEGHEIGSAVIGQAQGFYVASSQDGTSKTVLLTACFEGGEDSLTFFGVHRMVAPESHIAVIGGTGKYEQAKGFAVVQNVQSGDQGTTDGVETLLEFSVHLS
ncbi:hypothetical protein LUZ60_012993 [Juncus effusus]|nr:hypothetical protein LUZ60_012993 [Juncus effusus]